MFKILIPCSGDKLSNLKNLTQSIDSQIVDSNVECFFLEDEVSKKFRLDLEKLCGNPSNKFLVENNFGRRLYGLFNIFRFLDTCDFSKEEADPIIGIIDCDDMLWGKDCLQNIKNQYDLGFDCVWTANELKGLGINYSGRSLKIAMYIRTLGFQAILKHSSFQISNLLLIKILKIQTEIGFSLVMIKP